MYNVVECVIVIENSVCNGIVQRRFSVIQTWHPSSTSVHLSTPNGSSSSVASLIAQSASPVPHRSVRISSTLYLGFALPHLAMAKDRTAEFHNTLLSIKSRSATPQGARKDEAKQSLIPQSGQAGSSKGKNGKGKDEAGGKSEFGRLAAGIAKDINATTMKLQKLAQCELDRLDRVEIVLISCCYFSLLLILPLSCSCPRRPFRSAHIRCLLQHHSTSRSHRMIPTYLTT